MAKRLRAIIYRLLQIALLALLIYGFALTLPADLAVLLAGDYLLYFETATAVWLAAQATRLRHAFDYARAVVARSWRIVRRRSARSVRSLARRTSRGSGDDERPLGLLVPA